MIKRDISKLLSFYLKTFPITLIVGPRQSGKTTLVKTQLKSWTFFDLEKISDYNAVSFDIESFFDSNSSKVALDEAQRLPEIFSSLRSVVDKNRKNGRYVLTGSASPSLLKGVSDSLAGRIGIIELTPFGVSELQGIVNHEKNRWFFGGYPPLYHLKSARQKTEWIESYISTFVERDIISFGIKIQSARFRKFIYMLANTHGGILNVMNLSRSMGISQHTVEYYLNVLENAFIIRRLYPYFANIGKRLVKSPKLYIRDSGLFNHLSGLRKKTDLEYFDKRGASWEGFIIEEIIRLASLKYTKPGIYYWRTHAGAEVDLIIETGLNRKIAIEIKLGKIVKTGELAGIKSCMADLKIKNAIVIYTGEQIIKLGNGIQLIPWSKFIKNHKKYL